MVSPEPHAPAPRSIWRRMERRFVGFWMSVIVWFVERRLLKAEKKRLA